MQETCIASAWYEVLCVVHLMAMLLLLQVNLALIPKESTDEREGEVSEGLLCFDENDDVLKCYVLLFKSFSIALLEREYIMKVNFDYHCVFFRFKESCC